MSRCSPHSAHPFRAALLFAVLLLSLAAAPVRAQDRDPVVAKVNGVEVRLSDLAIAEEEAGQIPPMSADAKRDYLVTLMTDMLLWRKPPKSRRWATAQISSAASPSPATNC
jgi:peptidyl-prolyl cis-trans isomerase C